MKSMIRFMPAEQEILVDYGTSLLTAGKKAGVPIRTRCGGQAACLMCKVKVLNPSSCSTAGSKERRKLGDTLLKQNFRLACQAKAMSPTVIVEVPEDPLKAAVRKKLQALKQKDNDELW